MEKHEVLIQHGDPSQHRSQVIVERYNRRSADRLFSYQYHRELEDPSKSNREWVSRLQNVVSALNNERTRLIEMKPIDAIKETPVKQGFSQPVKNDEEKLFDVGTKVRYLYEPGELEGQQYGGERRKRSTDPIWSVNVYKIKNSKLKAKHLSCTRVVTQSFTLLRSSDNSDLLFLFVIQKYLLHVVGLTAFKQTNNSTSKHYMILLFRESEIC